MSTKVLNKLVNICTTLSGGEVSSGTSTESTYNALSESEIFDLIYPVESIYVSNFNKDPFQIFGYGTWSLAERYDLDVCLITSVSSLYKWYRSA